MTKFIKLTFVNDLEPGNDAPASWEAWLNPSFIQMISAPNPEAPAEAKTQLLISAGSLHGPDQAHVKETIDEILKQL